MADEGAVTRVDVLVVDDDDALRAAVVRGLRKAGWSVAGAGSGSEAVELAARTRPSAVVLDVCLPDAGGLGAARELRRRLGDPALPVLFVTGLSTPLVRRSLAPAPVLQKPFRFAELVREVRGLLGRPWEARPA